MNTLEGSFGGALLDRLKLTEATDAVKACALALLDATCVKLFEDEPKLMFQYPDWDELTRMIYGNTIKDPALRALMLCASTAEDIAAFGFDKIIGTTEDSIGEFIRDYADDSPLVSRGDVTCYAVALCFEDLQRPIDLEIFECERWAISAAFKNRDHHTLGLWVLYEVTVPDYIATDLPKEISASELSSYEEIGSLLHFLHPKTPNLKGSGYWVEGAGFGDVLLVGRFPDVALALAKKKSRTNDTEAGVVFEDKQVFNVFFETDRVFDVEEDAIYLPARHVLSQIPLGTVRSFLPANSGRGTHPDE